MLLIIYGVSYSALVHIFTYLIYTLWNIYEINKFIGFIFVNKQITSLTRNSLEIIRNWFLFQILTKFNTKYYWSLKKLI